MKASVIAISTTSGLIAARLEDGDHVVLEVHSGKVAIRDRISSSTLDDLGSIAAINESSGERLSLYGQSGRATLHAAIALVRRG